MKQIIFLFIIFIFYCFNNSIAQKSNEADQRIRGGAILGITASQVDGDDYAGYHKVGIVGGFVGQIPVSKKFFFSTEILYVQKGAKRISVEKKNFFETGICPTKPPTIPTLW